MKKSLLLLVLFAIALAPAAYAADGAAIFKAKCAMCHGADGAGQTGMGKTLGLKGFGSKEVQALTDAELIKITTDGKGKMPSYKAKLSEEEIKAVVAFIRTFKK